MKTRPECFFGHMNLIYGGSLDCIRVDSDLGGLERSVRESHPN
jgi:hypothetical protein